VHGSRIVDEHVDPRVTRQNVRGQAADRRLHRKVGNKACHARILARLGLDLGNGHFCAHRVAPDDGDIRAERRQSFRGRETDAIGCARNEHLFSAHLILSRPRTELPARAVAARGTAGLGAASL
jgi:hypothetical protein